MEKGTPAERTFDREEKVSVVPSTPRDQRPARPITSAPEISVPQGPVRLPSRLKEMEQLSF